MVFIILFRNINTPTVLNMRGEYILEDENHNEVKYLPQRYLALPTKNEKWLCIFIRFLDFFIYLILFDRWFTINVSSVHYYRLMMDMTNVGPNPPPVLSLSDGGHLENLGILPLLKLRLEKIVVVDGGRSILDKDYGKSLMIVLDLARKKLGCSFSALDGRDIAEDIRDSFVERSPGSQPSNYRYVM